MLFFPSSKYAWNKDKLGGIMVWLFGAETDKEANFGYSVPTLYIKSPRARCRTMTATTAETIFVPIVAVYRESTFHKNETKHRQEVKSFDQDIPDPETTQIIETLWQRRIRWEELEWAPSKRALSSAPPNQIVDSRTHKNSELEDETLQIPPVDP